MGSFRQQPCHISFDAPDSLGASKAVCLWVLCTMPTPELALMPVRIAALSGKVVLGHFCLRHFTPDVSFIY